MLSYPPVPEKAEVLRQAQVWLEARQHAQCVGQSHLLIQRLTETLKNHSSNRAVTRAGYGQLLPINRR